MEAAARCGDLQAELRRLRTLSISCFSGSRSGSSTQGPSPLVLLLSPNNIPQSRVVPRFSPAAGCLGGRRMGGMASTGLEGDGFWHGPYNFQDGAPPELLFVLSPQVSSSSRSFLPILVPLSIEKKEALPSHGLAATNPHRPPPSSPYTLVSFPFLF